eukprot:jgi/Ulvmu1/2245/UM013_0092.1
MISKQPLFKSRGCDVRRSLGIASPQTRVSLDCCGHLHRRHVALAEAKELVEPQTKLNSKHLLIGSLSTLRRVLWPICWVYVAQSVLLFIIERCTQRLTNACFLLLKGGGYGAQQIGSLWWLSVDPAVTEFSTGYSYISFAFTCLSFPASALVSCVALLALFRIASEAVDAKSRAALVSTSAAPPPSPRVRPTPAAATPTEQPAAAGIQPDAAPARPSAARSASTSAAPATTPAADGAAPANSACSPAVDGAAPSAPTPQETRADTAQASSRDTGMYPSRHSHDSGRKVADGAPRQDGLLTAAQAAYSLLSDDGDPGSGSDSGLGGAQGVVGAAEQQLTAADGAGDKSAPAKQQSKAGAAAGAAVAGGAAAPAAGGDGSGSALKEAPARAALPRQKRPRLWSVKKAVATVTAVIREDMRAVYSTYLLVAVFEAAVLLASTVFVTLPLTIPRLLNVQLAVPLAAAEGLRGRDAMCASKARMFGYRRTAAVMLALVFVLQKALPPVSAVLISSLPHKVIVQVPEAVVVVLLAGQALLFGASQMKGLAALLIYNHTAHAEVQGAASDGPAATAA